MTPFTEIYERFLSMITEYEFIHLDEEDFEHEIELKLEVALSKLFQLEMVMDRENKTFDRELTPLEKTILAHALLVEWITQRVYDVQNMRNHMASKDFTIFSTANHLSEMMNLHSYANKELLYLLGQYTLSLSLVQVKNS